MSPCASAINQPHTIVVQSDETSWLSRGWGVRFEY
jgi:hypothetical protein